MNAAGVTVALTGASGAAYGLRLVECLLRAEARVALIYSPAARAVVAEELDLALPVQPLEAERLLRERYDATPGQLRVYGQDDWCGSGFDPADAVVVCPCAMATLDAVADGLADGPIERMVELALEAQRKVVLVPRETPLSLHHLEQMAKLARAGAIILPASPGFQHRPQYIEDLIDFVVARILDHLGVAHALLARRDRERICAVLE